MIRVEQPASAENPNGWPAIVLSDAHVERAIGHAIWALGDEGVQRHPQLFAAVLRASLCVKQDCDCGGCTEVIERQRERQVSRNGQASERHAAQDSASTT
jgi:hypothetical protein